MKALKITGLLFAAVACATMSYLVYPVAYHKLWADTVVFITNETTRQWSGLILILTAMILVGMAVWIIRTPSPKPRQPSLG